MVGSGGDCERSLVICALEELSGWVATLAVDVV